MQTLEERFWSKVNIAGPDECWEWTAGLATTGYGQLNLGRRGAGVQRSHRISWEIHNGPIPEGLEVCHTCDNRLCVNPAHLWLGTHADNMGDAATKRRFPSGEAHHGAKLTEDAVRKIRAHAGPRAEVAEIFNVSERAIYAVRRGKAWTHVD